MESSNNTYFVVKFSIGLWDKSKCCKLMSLSNTPFGTVLMLLWLKEREVKESRPSKAPLCTSWILLNDSIMATKLLNASKAYGKISLALSKLPFTQFVICQGLDLEVAFSFKVWQWYSSNIGLGNFTLHNPCSYKSKILF